MNSAYLIAGAVVLLVILAIAASLASRRRRVEQLQNTFGPEYDRTVRSMGDEGKAQAELEERRKRVDAYDIRPLAADERERFLGEWKSIQARFVDEPSQAIVDADRLIVEVMQARGYPMADFDQRAADISVNHPTVVSNYRAAREIAVKNEQHQADTEALRQAMIYYRSLFEELLGAEAVMAKEKQL